MNQVPKTPAFAIIRLRPTDDVFALFRLLLQEGYRDVSFVNRLQESFMNDRQTTDAITQTEKTQTTTLLPPLSLPMQGGSLINEQLLPGISDIKPFLHQPQSNQQNFFPSSPLLSASSFNNSDLNGPLATSFGSFPFLKGLTGTGNLNFLQSAITTSEMLPSLPLIFRNALQNSAPSSPLTFGCTTSMPTSHVITVDSYGSLLNQQLPLNMTIDHASGLQSQQQHETATLRDSMLNGHHSSGAMDCKQIPSQTALDLVSCIEAVSPAAHQMEPVEVPATEAAKITAASQDANGQCASNSKVNVVRPRGRISSTEDPLYATCSLCKNRIMCSRVSNLTNHVRRHAAMKQFQCCYCEYSHNEMAKVRLHMLHNHKDNESQPVNNITSDMKVSWDMLMEQCFPDHWKPRKRSAASLPLNNEGSVQANAATAGEQQQSAENSFQFNESDIKAELSPNVSECERQESEETELIGTNSESDDDLQPPPSKMQHAMTTMNAQTAIAPQSNVPDQQNQSAAAAVQPNVSSDLSQNLVSENDHLRPGPTSRFVECAICHEPVNVKGRARHVRNRHLPEQPFVCSICGYDQAEHNKVNLHILLKHRNESDNAQILVRNFDQMVEQLTEHCFGRNNGVVAANENTSSTPIPEPQQPQQSYATANGTNELDESGHNELISSFIITEQLPPSAELPANEAPAKA